MKTEYKNGKKIHDGVDVERRTRKKNEVETVEK